MQLKHFTYFALYFENAKDSFRTEKELIKVKTSTMIPK